jgi:hypothetical protein
MFVSVLQAASLSMQSCFAASVSRQQLFDGGTLGKKKRWGHVPRGSIIHHSLQQHNYASPSQYMNEESRSAK